MRTFRRLRLVLSIAMCALALTGLTPTILAGTVFTVAQPQARVTKKIDNSKRVMLYGHVPQVVKQASPSVTGRVRDMGRIKGNTPMQGMRIVLRSSPEQARELRRVIDEQQDKRTANYHQWMTPEDFGNAFGASESDVRQVSQWLTKQGFKIENVTKGKRVIQFSGTSGQVEQAFQTEVRGFQVNGETHVSVSREISVPEALAPVVAGVNGLHNFFRKGHMGDVQKISDLKLGPKFTSGSGVHYVGPADFATIYNTSPLLQAGINGTGVTIAVVGRSDILMSDVQTYRQMFNLPPNDPIFIHAGQDNGTEPGDDGESDLDVEISGGIAPNATVQFVVGTPTFNVDGITNSIEYIVENNIADIMSISYGSCEAVEGVGGNQLNNALFEQAAAQGISVFVASGDNGPAGCDNSNNTFETGGYAVGSEAATPYSVAVGGTEFYTDPDSSTTYWSATTNPLYLNSALAYIPEYPWNESRAANFTSTASSGLSGLWSGSGGISAYYTKPSWQQGPGVPTSDPTLIGGNWVASVTITNPGSGYTTAPTVTFGSGCVAAPQASSTITGGQVTGITFVTTRFHGYNCTSTPTVTFGAAPGGGTTATGTAVLGPMQNPVPLVTGVPHRYLPDLSLNGASGHDPTLFCSEGVCQLSSSGALLDAGLVGGTSVAAPSMAGIQALINQANGGRQGMPGYIYYALAAAQNTANCNSAMPPLPGSNCAFQDVTVGNNLVCAVTGSSCTGTTNKIGFNAGVGYDLATGLGSVNAANLSNQWKNVVFNSSTTTLNLSQTSGINHGTSVTLSGTVTGNVGTPTGDVAFIVSQGAIGWPVDPVTGAPAGTVAFATLSGGSYSANLDNLPAGTYTVTARYGGDSSFASSSSVPVLVSVNSEGSTVTISPQSINQTACTITFPVSSYTYGALAWIEVAVAGNSQKGVATGTVTITDNGNPIATATLDPNGKGYLVAGAIPSSSCIYDYIFAQSPTLTGGVHLIGASYSGDGTFGAGTATPVSVTVGPLTPTVTLAAGATLITSGFADQLTATMGGLTSLTGSGSGSSAPTGTVTFTDTTTSTVLGMASVVPTISFSGNIYTYGATAVLSTTGITQTGANSITASYSGDSNYTAATSTAATVTVGTGTATTTTVTSNGNPTTLNGRPTFTATMAGGTAPVAGTVTFYDGTSVLGTGTVGSGHTATFRPASGAAFFGGVHNITATFGGNATFMASTSPVFQETVTKGTVVIVLMAKTAGNGGQNYTFAATLTPSQTNATYAPNQANVQFFDGATLIGSAQPITVTTAQGGYNLWTATMATSSLSPGTHTITSTYTDVNYTTGSSPNNTQTVYVGNGSPGQSVGIYSPLNGSTLSSTSATFKWFPVPGGQFWLDVGPTQGANTYYQSGNLGTVLSKSVVGLPNNGSPVWARLWTLINGSWTFTDTNYTAYNVGSTKGIITNPTPGSTLTGSSVTFTWSAGTGATAYWLDAGSVPGGNQYYQSGNLGNVLTTTANGLPIERQHGLRDPVLAGWRRQWLNNAYTYTAYNGGRIAGRTDNSRSGLDVHRQHGDLRLDGGRGCVGLLAGCRQHAGRQPVLSVRQPGQRADHHGQRPADGRQHGLRDAVLLVGGQWFGNTYTYTAFNQAGALGVMQTPIRARR